MDELLAVDAVVLVFASMDRFQVEGVGEDELKSGLLAGIGEPGSGDEAFIAYGETVTPGADHLEEEVEVVVLDVHEIGRAHV